MSDTAQQVSQGKLSLPFLVLFLAIPTLIELTLMAADAGLIGTTRLRPTVYQYCAFWAGLLDNWRPNYAAQPWLMFVTYSFLHAGFWHLLGNMVCLVFLMKLTAARLNGRAFLLLYVVSAMGGAVAFAIMGPAVTPMVGASGALFGLVGAWRFVEWLKTESRDRRRWIALRDLAVLAAINLFSWWQENGALAWEAHLGGFVTGIATMAVILIWRSPPDVGETV